MSSSRGIEWQLLRRQMIDTIIATDMADHFELLATYRLRRRAKDFFAGEPQDVDRDKRLAMQLCIKAADLGYMTLPWEQCFAWTENVYAEFWAQGDMESSLGLPISPLCDRSDAGTAKWFFTNERFSAAFVLPMFWELSKTEDELTRKAARDRLRQPSSSVEGLMFDGAEHPPVRRMTLSGSRRLVYGVCVSRMNTHMKMFKQRGAEALAHAADVPS